MPPVHPGRVQDNLEVGRFMVKGLAKRPEGKEIIVGFSLDSDGILQVSATEKATGLAKSITIRKVLTDGAGDSLSQAREKIPQLFEEDSAERGDDPDDLPFVEQIRPKTGAGNSRHVRPEPLQIKPVAFLPWQAKKTGKI